jgi:hypothetical protein
VVEVIDPPRGGNPSLSSEESRLIVDDVSRFWAALDQPTSERVRALEETYLRQGIPGLTDFLRLRIGSAEELAATVKKHEAFYRSIRSTTLKAEKFEDQIRATFFNLSQLLPEAIFPDVYFLIGKLTTAGTIGRSGILIGLEMFCFTAQTELQGLSAWHKAVLKAPEALPHIVAHELIHVQQFALGDHSAATASLLGLSVSEGIADFLGEMISGEHINQHVHDWGPAQGENPLAAIPAGNEPTNNGRLALRQQQRLPPRRPRILHRLSSRPGILQTSRRKGPSRMRTTLDPRLRRLLGQERLRPVSRPRC